MWRAIIFAALVAVVQSDINIFRDDPREKEHNTTERPSPKEDNDGITTRVGVQGPGIGLYKVSSTYSNCLEVQQGGYRTNGIYLLQVFGQVIEVYCDLTTDGGGWTVIQRRADFPPALNFYRDWQSYKSEFGDLNEEFWLGLDHIHLLTASQPSMLRIEFEDFEGASSYAKYERFYVASETNKYQLLVAGYSGNAGDSLKYHNGHEFSTWDRDNDSNSGNCAERYFGAWWHADCHESNLNGKYLRGNHTSFADGVAWKAWRGYYYSLKTTEMKIRPIDI